MYLSEIASELNLEILNDDVENWEKAEVKGGFCSDLLSIVMGEAKTKDLWITKQVHLNVVAVAVLAELTGVIVCGKAPDTETLKKATLEKIPILYTKECVFVTAGKLYNLLNPCNGK